MPFRSGPTFHTNHLRTHWCPSGHLENKQDSKSLFHHEVLADLHPCPKTSIKLQFLVSLNKHSPCTQLKNLWTELISNRRKVRVARMPEVLPPPRLNSSYHIWTVKINYLSLIFRYAHALVWRGSYAIGLFLVVMKTQWMFVIRTRKRPLIPFRRQSTSRYLCLETKRNRKYHSPGWTTTSREPSWNSQTCNRSCSASKNDAPHLEQLYGFSPLSSWVCCNKCTFRRSPRVYCLPQNWHTCGFWPLCRNMWRFKSTACVKRREQTWHSKGRAPVWTRRWRLSRLEKENSLSHFLQRKTFWPDDVTISSVSSSSVSPVSLALTGRP